MSRIAAARLANQRLSVSGPRDPVETVAWFGAVQAQEYGAAKWAVAQRTRGNVDDAAVEAAVAEGRILRTHVLRPTWHFVLPAEIRWMLELTAPRVHALNAYYYRQLLFVYVDSRYAIHTFLLAGAESVPQLTSTTVAGYRGSPTEECNAHLFAPPRTLRVRHVNSFSLSSK